MPVNNPTTVKFRTFQNIMVAGMVEVTTLPPIIISEPSGFVQSSRLVSIKNLVLDAGSSGSSVEWKIERYRGESLDVITADPVMTDSDSGISSTAPTNDAYKELQEDDLLLIRITGVAGSPKDLALTLVFEHVAA